MDKSEPAEKPPSNCILCRSCQFSELKNFSERNDERKRGRRWDDRFQEYLSAGELFWPRVCNLRWFLFRRSYLFFRLSLSHIASLLYNYDKNKPREATRVTENGKYPLKVQASARCWPLTNVVESSVKDWMVVRECGKRREK